MDKFTEQGDSRQIHSSIDKGGAEMCVCVRVWIGEEGGSWRSEGDRAGIQKETDRGRGKHREERDRDKIFRVTRSLRRKNKIVSFCLSVQFIF